ncbi:cytochrome c maturation protein CcmE [Thermogemmatispora sp.]|uniref:cytochrome c maturation protein CcmE n=1 Tax=Thermogemmatispora sp. TaxID=1968838 RepID=UPI0035E43171
MQSAVVSTQTEKDTVQIPARKRRRFPAGLLVAGLAIAAAVTYLIVANTRSSAVYYMTIAELKHCTTCSSQAVRVMGLVQPGSITRHDQTVSFVITDNRQSLPVVYSGVVPDIFRAGIQVVVEGYYHGQGAFQAQTLLAKCPSKFQAATPTPSSS